MTRYSLLELGWHTRFAAQLHDNLIPQRVTDIHKSFIGCIGVDGPERLNMTPDLAKQGVTVGDWVLKDPATDQPVQVLARHTLLKRRNARTNMDDQLIAANVNTLFVVSSCNRDFNVARLERYLALAHQGGVVPVLILTKADLADSPGEYETKAMQSLPGVRVHVLNARDPATAETLAPYCSAGQTVALLGTSGVGKTTLTNALTGLNQRTQDIRNTDARGRHTTTARSMHRMQAGGWLIDTPGMRALRLADARAGLEMVFADIEALAIQCKFNDCAHESEPGCAVRGAVEPERLKRWRKLMQEDLHSAAPITESRTRYHAPRKPASGRARP
jgi:ribosome biogenesis GTPase